VCRIRMLQVILTPFEKRPPLRAVSADPPPVAPLAERLQRLELDAWAGLYIEHWRLIRGVLVGHLGYTADLEDVTQQVFETALKLVSSHKAQLSGDSSGLRAWLVAIALRLARAERRRQFKTWFSSEQPECENQSTDPLDPASMQLLQRAHRVLLLLPAKLRSPWLLRHLERMSLDEIATSTGVSLATVKRRLLAADQRFQKLAQRDPVLREHLQSGGAT